MKFTLFLAFVASAVCLAPLHVVEPTIGQSFIVVFHDNTSLSHVQDHIKQFHEPAMVNHLYQHTIRGYAAQIEDATLEAVRADPMVDFVETDSVVSASQCSTQTPVPSWGLARSSNMEANFGTSMVYHTNAGEGSRIYIIDTGLLKISNDFTGRVGEGISFIPGQSQDTDGSGHGTHCGSTAGGTKYGLAKKATLFGVKVLSNQGTGSSSGVIGGMDWTAGEAKKYPKKCVANLSLGGGKSQASNNAVDALVRADCFVAVAAGNSNADSCRFSPASAPLPMTVGSTMSNNHRSSFSNWGPQCTDIFAPGTQITAAYRPNAGSTATLSGTSMASPHIAGLGAVLRSLHPDWTPEQVKEQLLKTSADNQISMNCGGECGRSPNKVGVVLCP